MGQYYHPISIEKKQYVSGHFYDNGIKLMEHSYIGNNFMCVIENLLAKGGLWFGTRIVWAGNYAEKEPCGKCDKCKQGEECTVYEDNRKNLNELTRIEIKPVYIKKRPYRFLVNRTKKMYVDLSKVPVSDEGTYRNKGGKLVPYTLKIHPLPLLTCEGNGNGGGDFFSEDPNNLVGSWARDVIQPQTKLPKGDYKELIFDLIEK